VAVHKVRHAPSGGGGLEICDRGQGGLSKCDVTLVVQYASCILKCKSVLILIFVRPVLQFRIKNIYLSSYLTLHDLLILFIQAG